MTLRRTLAAVSLAAGALLTSTPAQACQQVGDLYAGCTGVDTERGCVYSNGHVDGKPYRVACSPR